MANTNTIKITRAVNIESHGIELKEVNFREFERRKTPRLTSYKSFEQYTESLDIDESLLKID